MKKCLEGSPCNYQWVIRNLSFLETLKDHILPGILATDFPLSLRLTHNSHSEHGKTTPTLLRPFFLTCMENILSINATRPV